MNWVCVICAAQFADSETPPERCPICEDERQYVGAGGQRWTTLADMDGAPLADKAEGIALADGDGARVWVVTDADDPARPAELCEVALREVALREVAPRVPGRADR